MAKKNWGYGIAIAVGVLIVGGIGSQLLSYKGKVFQSLDGGSQITLPLGWKENFGIGAGEIQVSNFSKSSHIMVVKTDKDFYRDVTLEEFGDLNRARRGEETPADVTFTQQGPTEITSINGHEAEQYEIWVTSDDVKIVVIDTVVETPDNFYQVVGVTDQSTFEAHYPTMQQIITSFQEVR